MVVRWTLTDSVTSAVYTFEINPNESDMINYGVKKRLNFETVTSNTGELVAFQGRDEPLTGSFSGDILTDSFVADLKTWCSKDYVLWLNDDLGGENPIFITSFEVKRKRSAIYPWRATYTVNYVIVQ